MSCIAEAGSVQDLLIVGHAHEGDALDAAPLTGHGFRHLTRMPRLEKVQFCHSSGGFANLRHEDIEAVVRGLQGLLLLRVSGGHQISASLIAELQRSFPRVHLDLSTLGYRTYILRELSEQSALHI